MPFNNVCHQKGRIVIPVLFFMVIRLQSVQPGDWTQYRGPHLDGTTEEKIFLRDWPKEGPPQLWKAETPSGFSSITVAGGKAYTLVCREDQDGIRREVCIAMDAATGKELWNFPMCIAKYDDGGDSGTPDNNGGDGPRSTPALDDSRVYLLDSQINLYCLNNGDGKVFWEKNILDDFGGRNITWQNAASPLVDCDLVFVQGGGPGQSLIAFDKVTGDVVWKKFDELMTHTTPVPATIQDVHQIIFLEQSGLLSVEPKTGKELWRHAFPFKIATAASPVVYKDLVFCTAGYGVGAGLCRIRKINTGFETEEIWQKPNELMIHWSTPICKNGYLYGMFSFAQHGQGPIKCVELLSGKESWSNDGYGPGNVILAGDLLVALTDKGELVLIEPSSSAYKEVARAKILNGKCWSTPAMSNGYLFVRSTKEAVCLDVSKAE